MYIGPCMTCLQSLIHKASVLQQAFGVAIKTLLAQWLGSSPGSVSYPASWRRAPQEAPVMAQVLGLLLSHRRPGLCLSLPPQLCLASSGLGRRLRTEREDGNSASLALTLWLTASQINKINNFLEFFIIQFSESELLSNQQFLFSNLVFKSLHCIVRFFSRINFSLMHTETTEFSFVSKFHGFLHEYLLGSRCWTKY